MSSEKISAIESISRECFLSFSSLPNATLLDDDGVFGVVTDIPLTFFNGIASTNLDGADRQGSLARVTKPFRDRRRAFRWWVTPSSRPIALERILMEHGLRHAYDAPGMFAELTELPPEVRSPDLTIKRVVDVAGMEIWANLLVTVFARPAVEAAAWVNGYRHFGFHERSPWAHFVGFVNDQPVATATVLVSGELAGVYHIGTLEPMRGRGIGSALTLAAMQHASAAGARNAVLQSSESGLSVYRSLGFAEECHLSLYDWRP